VILNDLLPHKVYINLDRRPDRRARMEGLFARLGLGPVARFAAFDGKALPLPSGWAYPPGAYGCLQSHLAVVRQARSARLPSLLIFEDDCVFADRFHERFSGYASALPAQWDMLLLGGGHVVEPQRIAEHLGRVSETWLAHAYALRSTMYDAFIAACEQEQEPLDYYTATLQKDFDCYCFVPDLVWQLDEDSDIVPDL